MTSFGERHVRAVIGSELYQKKKKKEIVIKWRDEPLLLSKSAAMQPQEAYSAYIHGFKSKYKFFNRTIPTMKNHIKNSGDVLRNHFIPAIMGRSLISEHLEQLIALLM